MTDPKPMMDLAKSYANEASWLEGKWMEALEQRDAARAMADQLAADLKARVIKEWWADLPSLVEWEARDWRPISSPGSGLDGLLADINREES